MVLEKYFGKEQDPVKGSNEHLPIAVPSQSHSNELSLQN